MGKVVKGLKTSDGNQIKADLEANGSVTIEGLNYLQKKYYSIQNFRMTLYHQNLMVEMYL